MCCPTIFTVPSTVKPKSVNCDIWQLYYNISGKHPSGEICFNSLDQLGHFKEWPVMAIGQMVIWKVDVVDSLEYFEEQDFKLNV